MNYDLNLVNSYHNQIRYAIATNNKDTIKTLLKNGLKTFPSPRIVPIGFHNPFWGSEEIIAAENCLAAFHNIRFKLIWNSNKEYYDIEYYSGNFEYFDPTQDANYYLAKYRKMCGL